MATRKRKAKSAARESAPRRVVIAGPNGAGKTTLVRKNRGGDPQISNDNQGEHETIARSKRLSKFARDVEAALRDAARTARKTARMYGTPIYVWENGKVVAKKP